MDRLSSLKSQLVHSVLEQNQVDSKKSFGRDVYIVAGKRTPIGSFLGKLSKFTGPQLGGMAIRETLKSINLDPKEIDDVIMGNVCQAGIGQNPARQAAISGGIGVGVPCTTINKACCSSIKALAYGAMAIGMGLNETVLVGGFESMSNVPFVLEKHRKGHGYGDQILVDELQLGLKDAFTKQMMGLCADGTAKKFDITRQQQDDYTTLSYARATEATKNGRFKDEIAPIKLTDKETLTEDEEYKRFNKQKMMALKPTFSKTGTVTAANASKIDDAGIALVMMSEQKMKSKNLKPLARIIGYADAEIEPVDFCVAPSYAIKKLLERTGFKIDDIDCFEINEAFAVAALANQKILNLDINKLNVNGGAVSLGHPIGFSGSRVVLSLISVLKQKKGKYGIAALCNGGGGSTAVLIENLQ